MLLDYKQIDDELLPLLDELPTLDITRDNIVPIRAMLAEQDFASGTVDVQSFEKSIRTDDGDLDLYVFRKNDRAGQPALLWIHGGGYVLGDADDERAKVIASRCDCTVFSVDYRLAPEYPFPAGPNDCYAALRWLTHEAASLGIDRDRLAIGGASAGGGMAAGVALMNRDLENFPLRLQLLIYPMLDNLHETPSGQYTNHPVWKRETSFNAWEMYLDGVPGRQASPYAAAARATDLTGLPAAYVCVGTEDLFRDEDMDYARRLIEAGVACELAVFPGLYHGADISLPQATISKRLNNSFLTAVSDALNQ